MLLPSPFHGDVIYGRSLWRQADVWFGQEFERHRWRLRSNCLSLYNDVIIGVLRAGCSAKCGSSLARLCKLLMEVACVAVRMLRRQCTLVTNHAFITNLLLQTLVFLCMYETDGAF